jgi:hypothetical protein
MSERSVELAKQNITETIKYDYFIVGISAATFAYFAKDFKPINDIALNSSTLVAASLLLLALSVLSGLRKIKLHTAHLAVNSKYLDTSSLLAAYKKNSIEGGVAMNSNTGEILQPSESSIKARELQALILEFKSGLDRLGDKVYLTSIIRDICLYLAYVVLVTSKFLPLFNV